MTEDVHRLRVEYNSAAERVVEYYALDAATWRKAQAWQAGQSSLPTAQDFARWLHSNGGTLDRTDGPAVILAYADGSRIVEWWDKGTFLKREIFASLESFPDRVTLAPIPGVTVLPPQP